TSARLGVRTVTWCPRISANGDALFFGDGTKSGMGVSLLFDWQYAASRTSIQRCRLAKGYVRAATESTQPLQRSEYGSLPDGVTGSGHETCSHGHCAAPVSGGELSEKDRFGWLNHPRGHVVPANEMRISCGPS